MSGSAPHDWGLPSKSNLILVRKELNLQSLSRERRERVKSNKECVLVLSTANMTTATAEGESEIGCVKME